VPTINFLFGLTLPMQRTPRPWASSTMNQKQKQHIEEHHDSRLLPHFNKGLILGLGQLGLPIAKYVKGRGFDTYGYDINREAIETANTVAGIKQVTDFGSDDFDVYIISISTHKPEDIFSPEINGVL
jgi:phosphoglycerate dehydrogenase-like enzyme